MSDILIMFMFLGVRSRIPAGTYRDGGRSAQGRAGKLVDDVFGANRPRTPADDVVDKLYGVKK